MQTLHPRLKHNNFDLIRLLLAAAVCLVHSYELSGYQELSFIGHLLSAEIAVKAFFVVSGFLIFMSYERSSSLLSYTKKRIRRIYPAYFTVIILCAFGLLAVSSKHHTDYFSLEWVRYLLANLSFMNFMQLTLPGVFENNNLAAVNGALWTLKIEAMFYLSVPIIVFFFRRFGRLLMIATIYAMSLVYTLLLSTAAEQTGSNIYALLAYQLPGQLSYFIAGAFLYYYLDVFERYIGYFVTGAVIALIVNAYWSLPIVEPFALAVVVIFFALFFYLGNFGKFGDFSYGVYILHFPIIQLFLHLEWQNQSPWLFLLSIIATTTIAAILMWHLVEKRFLSRSSHYISATKQTTHKNSH